MKIRMFGYPNIFRRFSFFSCERRSVCFIAALQCLESLKDYRANRENGEKIDLPHSPFPSAEFIELDIRDIYRQSSNKWPDSDGCYWWRIILNDGRVINDFYWTEDTMRGYPQKDEHGNDRHWFIVHNDKTGDSIEGFSQEPDYEKGFPDNEGYYWYYVKYTECGSIKDWMEEKDRRYLVRLINKLIESFNLFVRLPEELQWMILKFVVGGTLSWQSFEEANELAMQTNPTLLTVIALLTSLPDANQAICEQNRTDIDSFSVGEIEPAKKNSEKDLPLDELIHRTVLKGINQDNLTCSAQESEGKLSEKSEIHIESALAATHPVQSSEYVFGTQQTLFAASKDSEKAATASPPSNSNYNWCLLS